MIEKLLENWLDSASERSYQSVFVQILSAQGYRVVHSTRHTALEFGKDVLAIDQEGVGCAFQLKGHPRGKMGLSQFRDEIQPQLVQLMSQPVIFPGFPGGPHKAYLVSNGYFDEEVHRAVDDLNRQPQYPSKVSLLSRGDLLIWCKELGTNLWPSELGDSRLLIELFLSETKNILPAAKLSALISKILGLESPDTKLASKHAFDRAVTSAALLTGIATAPFAEEQNHFANTAAWTVLSMGIIAAGNKHAFRIDGAALGTLRLAQVAISDSLSELWSEASSREYLVEGDGFVDSEVYKWRYTLLLGLLSSLSLLDESSPCLADTARESLKEWLLKQHKHIDLWGEGAVANLIPWLLWLRKHDPTRRPDIELSELTRIVVNRNQNDSHIPLGSPYYHYEEIARHNFRLLIPGQESNFAQETFAGVSYTAQPLMHLLVRANLKQTCKDLWPNFSRLAHRVCLPDDAWEYCTLRIASGVEQTRIYPSTYSWEELKSEAMTPRDPAVPDELTARPWLLSLWWQVAPYRYNAETNRVFAAGVFPGWYG